MNVSCRPSKSENKANAWEYVWLERKFRRLRGPAWRFAKSLPPDKPTFPRRKGWLARVQTRSRRLSLPESPET